ncbi:toll-like receptor 7 [Limulus polyphemus]|uniref:Toll-like receptor 7 n=1 Tax=Limulus polyphemus TaxID=6850 RepID=A0ABM1BDE8_LIMPO|nr:toll-like receptor 7 [Limulus polyphemus]XP_013779736.1 toll-like receptor 7 [Limulus polyphemus]
MWNIKLSLLLSSIFVCGVTIRIVSGIALQCDEKIDLCKINCLTGNIDDDVKLECADLPKNNSLVHILQLDFKKLIGLQVQHSDLTDLKHFAHTKLEHLQSLTFINSKFNLSVLCDITESTPYLTNLTIIQENIQELKAKYFEKCKVNLTTLLMNENKMNEIENDALEIFSEYLTNLKLRDNKFIQVPQALQHLRKLQTLDLSNNKIKSVSNQDFLALNGLKSLQKLEMNELDCKCGLEKEVFFQWVTNKKFPEVTCASPKRLQFKKLAHLTKKDLCDNAAQTNAMVSSVVVFFIIVMILN